MLCKIHSDFILPKFLFLPAYQVLSSCVNYTVTIVSTAYFSTPQVTSTIELTITLQSSFEVTIASSIQPHEVILLHSPTPLLLPIRAHSEPINHPRIAAHDIPVYPACNILDMIVPGDVEQYSLDDDPVIMAALQYLSDQ